MLVVVFPSPAGVGLMAETKIKFEKALELMNGKELSYNQKIKLLAKIIDGLGIDKMELGRISSKLKSNLD
mgnify:CR=1 FL=1